MYENMNLMDGPNYSTHALSIKVAEVVKKIGPDKFNLKGDYVILSKDKQGLFLIPVFTDKKISANRCLSKEIIDKTSTGILELGSIYKLHVKCRFIVSPDKHYKRCENTCAEVLQQYPICKVGKPAEDCWANFAPRFGDWDYNNPECACWDFNERDKLDLYSIKTTDNLSIDDLLKL